MVTCRSIPSLEATLNSFAKLGRSHRPTGGYQRAELLILDEDSDLRESSDWLFPTEVHETLTTRGGYTVVVFIIDAGKD